MSQISFSDLVNGTVPDASDFNDRYNALKNRINNGMEADNIATGAVTQAKILDNAVNADKIDETDDYTWSGSHDFSSATLTGVAQVNGMVGSSKNLVVLRAGATSVDVDADHIIVWNSDNRAKLLSSVNLTAAITSSGANGLDTGAEASDTWYYIWVIYNGSAAAALLSTSATAPTLPSGYTYKALVSAVRNDGSSNFIAFNHRGKKYCYSTWQTMASGNVGTGPWVSITTSAYVPSALSRFAFGAMGQSAGGNVIMTNDSAVATSTTLAPNKLLKQVADVCLTWSFDIITADTLYWMSDVASATIYIHGFEITAI